MKYIDLFAGAGGLSEGFIRAGFDAVAHIEMNPQAVNTLRTRLAYWYLNNNNNLDDYYDYLKGKISRDALYTLIPENLLSMVLNYTMNEQNIKDIFAVIDQKLGNDRHVDLIVGGPPCQAYSLAGRAKQRRDEAARQSGNTNEDDPRKYLYRLYYRFLKHYKPDMFVFENVPGLLSADKGQHWRSIQNTLCKAGYEIEYQELNAKDFGVPQERRRIIVIGWRKNTRHFYPKFKKVEAIWTVGDVLPDLPSIQAGEQGTRYGRKRPRKYVTDHLRTPHDVLTWHIARPHIERDREIYRLAIREWLDNHKRINYLDIPPNLRTHKNLTDFSDRYKVVAPDVPYCHTMLAHISKDGHYFIHPDINQARSLTVREAARIQSFPDNYYFEGSRTSAFTQIGNAVPPMMSERIAEALREQL